MRVEWFIKTLAVAGAALTVGCGGCGLEGASVVDEGSGDPNEAPLWPLVPGYRQVRSTRALDLGATLRLDEPMEFEGREVMALMAEGRTLGTSGVHPSEPGTHALLSWGEDGVLIHGRARERHVGAPELAVPATVREGMRWETARRDYEVLGSRWRDTIFGPARVWTIRAFDRSIYGTSGATDQDVWRGAWLDFEYVEGYGPEHFVSDLRRGAGDPNALSAYVVVPLERRDAPARAGQVALEEVLVEESTMSLSRAMSAIEAPEVGADAWHFVVWGMCWSVSPPVIDGVGYSGGQYPCQGGFTLDVSTGELIEADRGAGHPFARVLAEDGSMLEAAYSGEGFKPPGDECTGAEACYHTDVGTWGGPDGTLYKITVTGDPLYPGLWWRPMVVAGQDDFGDFTYVGDLFGGIGASRHHLLGMPGDVLTLAARRSDGGIALATGAGDLDAAVVGHTVGALSATTSRGDRVLHEVTPFGAVYRLRRTQGGLAREHLGDLELGPDQFVASGAVIGDTVWAIVHEGFEGGDVQISALEGIGREGRIPPDSGRKALYKGRLSGAARAHDDALGTLWVAPQHADMLVCWDPEAGPLPLEGWELGGAPAAAVIRTGARDGCVLLVRAAEAFDLERQGAYRVTGTLPGYGEVMIGVDSAWAARGLDNPLARIDTLSRGMRMGPRGLVTPARRGGLAGRVSAAIEALPGLVLPRRTHPHQACDDGVTYNLGFGECCLSLDGGGLCYDPDDGALEVLGHGEYLFVRASSEEDWGVWTLEDEPVGQVAGSAALGVPLFYDEGALCGFVDDLEAWQGPSPAACVRGGELTPIAPGSGGAMGALLGGTLYDALGDVFVRRDLETGEVTRVPIADTLPDAARDERWRVVAFHQDGARRYATVASVYDRDVRMVELTEGGVVALDLPARVQAPAGATLVFTPELFVWLWDDATRGEVWRQANAHTGVLRAPRDGR